MAIFFAKVVARCKSLIGSIGISLLMAQVTKSSVARLAPESLAKVKLSDAQVVGMLYIV